MADEQTDPPGRRLSLKMIITVAGLLVVEAGLIIGAMMVFSPEEVPAATGTDNLDPVIAEEDKLVEVALLDARLPNNKSGIPYLYDTEIYVQVRNKHSVEVNEKVQRFYNEIKAEITAIWRTSDPRHFQEPKVETLTRKVSALMTDRFGVDRESGETIVQKCVIVMGTGFRVDQ